MQGIARMTQPSQTRHISRRFNPIQSADLRLHLYPYIHITTRSTWNNPRHFTLNWYDHPSSFMRMTTAFMQAVVWEQWYDSVAGGRDRQRTIAACETGGEPPTSRAEKTRWHTGLIVCRRFHATYLSMKYNWTQLESSRVALIYWKYLKPFWSLQFAMSMFQDL